jgi:hypothetical protein
MRRTYLAPIIGAIVLLGSMLPATALASVGSPDGLAGQSAVVDVSSLDQLAGRIRLRCALVQPDATPAIDSAALAPASPVIQCRWSAVDSPRVRVYQLWRIRDAANGGRRRLMARIRADEPLGYTDTRVAVHHAYTYKVVARAANGRKIAVSRRVTVRIPVPDEVLRLACALDSAGDQPSVVCKWSETSRARATRYVLWRSVDGGARERIYRTGLDGRRGFVDTDVKPGQSIRYVVVVRTRAGHTVGKGGPVVVQIPAVDPQPASLVTSGAR